jgi:hypothetical protein
LVISPLPASGGDDSSSIRLTHSDYVLKYEKSVPQMFKNMNMKQLCIYHQLDFERRFDNISKAKLME